MTIGPWPGAGRGPRPGSGRSRPRSWPRLRGGDLAALVALLDEEVTLAADAEASPAGRAAVLQGAARGGQGREPGRRPGPRRPGWLLVNGSVGVAWEPEGRPEVVLAFTVGPGPA